MTPKTITLILCAGLFWLASFLPADKEKDIVYWDQRPLTWADFKGAVPASSAFVAMTHSAIVLNFSGEGSTITFSVASAFYPKLSWKKKQVDAHILKHEQGHFDITEIHARLLRKQIQELTFKTYETIGTDVQRIFTKNSDACDNMQDLYDHETDHSKLKDAQSTWDLKIDQMLDSLDGWKSTNFQLDVGYLLD